MTADYHMHTPLCRHAEGSPTEYAAAAAALGLPEIGFSDHSPMPETFDDWRMLREELPRYLELVDEAREAHPDISIRLALEVDYFEDGHPWIEKLSTMADWDYLIGSVHYIAPGWDVDNPKWIGRFTESSVDEIWGAYWRIFEKAIRSGFFDLMGHADLPKKFGFRPGGDLRRYYEPVVQAATGTGVAFEINTAGWHKDCVEQYPATPFLELMQKAGVPLSISSDAHAPADVGRDFDKAITLAKEIGFTQTVRFQNRQRSSCPLP